MEGGGKRVTSTNEAVSSAPQFDPCDSNVLEEIQRPLRRLKIHFPNYGDGFLYLLLRQLKFDCCEAIHCLSQKTLPPNLRRAPTNLSLAEARMLLESASESEGEAEDLKNPQLVGKREKEGELLIIDVKRLAPKLTDFVKSPDRPAYPTRCETPVKGILKTDAVITETEEMQVRGSRQSNSRSSLSSCSTEIQNTRSCTHTSQSSNPRFTSPLRSTPHAKKSTKTAPVSFSHPPAFFNLSSKRVDDEYVSNRREKEQEIPAHSTSEEASLGSDATEFNSVVEELSDSSSKSDFTSRVSSKNTTVLLTSTEKEAAVLPDEAHAYSNERDSEGDEKLFHSDSEAEVEPRVQDNVASHIETDVQHESASLSHITSPIHQETRLPSPSTVHREHTLKPRPTTHQRRHIQCIDDEPLPSPSSYGDQQRIVTSNRTSDKPLGTTVLPSLDVLKLMESRRQQSERCQRRTSEFSSGLPLLIGQTKQIGLASEYSSNHLVRGTPESEAVADGKDVSHASPTSSPYAAALEGYLLREEKYLELYARTGSEEGLRLYIPSFCSADVAPEPPPPHVEKSGFRWWPEKRKYYRASVKATYLRPRHRFLLGPNVYRLLYDYQTQAVAWMFELFKERRGGILADEMGLGKTVQAATFLRGLYNARLATHTLLLLPLTLVDQWKAHLAKWCPRTRVCVYHGSKAERKAAIDHCFSMPLEGKGVTGAVLLTTYETFRNACSELRAVPCAAAGGSLESCLIEETRGGFPQYASDVWRSMESPLEKKREKEWQTLMQNNVDRMDESGRRPWDLVILDEAHKIKNPSNQCAQVVRLIESHCRLLLTGTPVTNSLDELWSLMDFAQPGLLGNHRTFKREFADPIKAGSARAAPESVVARKNRISLELQQLIAPFILRRTVCDTLVDSAQPSPNQMPTTAPQVTEEPSTSDVPQRDASACSTSKKTDIEGASKKEKVDTLPVGAVAKISALPKKTDAAVWVSLTSEQEIVYTEFLASRQIRDLLKSANRVRKGFNSMQAVSVLLKLCRHPVLLLPPEFQRWRTLKSSPHSGVQDNDDEDSFTDLYIKRERDNEAEKDRLLSENPRMLEEIKTEKWFQALLRIPFATIENLRNTSNKLRFLYDVLPSLSSRSNRCLIFSQSTKMLDLIEVTVLNPLNLEFVRIDGKVPNDLRQARIQHFKKSPDVPILLMTTKVGGLGLNLTCANHVIIVDPDWTPANDHQAVARVHRLGQKSDVFVYRLFTAGAIEDHAFRLQTFKQGLSKSALENVHQKLYFSEADMKQIFSLRTGGVSETLQILETVDPERKQNHEAFLATVKNDLCPAVYDGLWDCLVGISDVDALHKHQDQLQQSCPRRKETSCTSEPETEPTRLSVRKLHDEKYDETQLLDLQFLSRTANAQPSLTTASIASQRGTR